MSKGLRALERIKDFLVLNTKHWKQDVGYIEEELKVLEIIKPILQAAFIFKENGTEIGKIYMSKDVEKIIKEWLKHE